MAGVITAVAVTSVRLALLTAGLALAVCQVLHAGVTWPGLIGYLAAFGYLGWRPAWARNRPARIPARAGRVP